MPRFAAHAKREVPTRGKLSWWARFSAPVLGLLAVSSVVGVAMAQSGMEEPVEPWTSSPVHMPRAFYEPPPIDVVDPWAATPRSSAPSPAPTGPEGVIDPWRGAPLRHQPRELVDPWPAASSPSPATPPPTATFAIVPGTAAPRDATSRPPPSQPCTAHCAAFPLLD